LFSSLQGDPSRSRVDIRNPWYFFHVLHRHNVVAAISRPRSLRDQDDHLADALLEANHFELERGGQMMNFEGACRIKERPFLILMPSIM
jgi:hypothetical protein